MLARNYLQSFKRVFINGSCPKAGCNLATHSPRYHTLNIKSIPTLAKCETMANNGHNILPVHLKLATRGFKNPKAPRGLKTKQCAAKRFIKTGSGKLKCGHSGKAHLNSKKSRVRLARLNKKSYLTGVMFKKMNKLILTGK